MEKINLKIDIVSDIVCPWCVIGYKNLKKAISNLEKEIDFNIRWRAYELHPDIPKQGITKEKHIMNKFGDINRAKKTYDHIKKVGERAGFIFHFSKNQTIPNTFLAHRLLWYAEKKDKQTTLSEALFSAYFAEGKNVGVKKELLEISSLIGLNKKEVETFLNSNKGEKEVIQQEIKAREMNISGVPTYVINNKYLLQGGQEPETFIAFLRRIKEKEIASI